MSHISVSRRRSVVVVLKRSTSEVSSLRLAKVRLFNDDQRVHEDAVGRPKTGIGQCRCILEYDAVCEI